MSDYLDRIFGRVLRRRFPGYEARPGQVEYARAVDAAFDQGKHLLIEGPCGVGKSFGYLTPAVHHAARKERRVLVATANILLQEQLVRKDLPALARLLPYAFTHALIKGKNNYLCPARWEKAEAEGFRDLFETPESLDRLREWAGATATGDRSELDFAPPAELWANVCGDLEECEGRRCQEDRCFAWKARQEAQKAQIVVCNYHLLFSHLQVRAATGQDWILPPFDLVVCDEGHEMADVARDFFGFQVSPGTFRRIRRVLASEGASALAGELESAVHAFFANARGFLGDALRSRLRKPGLLGADGLFRALGRAAAHLEWRVQMAGGEREARRPAGALARAQAAEAKLKAALSNHEEGWVYWIERDASTVRVCGQPMAVAAFLREHLFAQARSVVVTSATLTAGGSFEFLRSEIGADLPAEDGQEAPVREKVVESPFRFPEQALLVVPEMSNAPTDPGFAEEVAETCARIVELARGRTLALFTSYRVMNVVRERLRDCGYPVLAQGDRPRAKLVEEFRSKVGTVLLGTASFWQGVDVPGEALSCLVIDRLPFGNPDDPVEEAIRERDPGYFHRRALPRAVLMLRQGFGRLIRSRTDRGVVVLLDRRIMDKWYGEAFLISLPPCPMERDLAAIGRFLAGSPSGRA